MNDNIVSAEIQELREDVAFHRQRADLLEARVTALVRRLKAAEALATALELVEWDEDDYCQWCHRWKKDDHWEKCPRQLALRQWQEAQDG